jgi:hypothetical protein
MAGLIITLSVMFFFGGIVMILGLGLKNMEEERAKSNSGLLEALDGPHFFARDVSDRTVSLVENADDSLVLAIEEFLKEELNVVNRFVSEPSVENLYRHVSRVAILN